MRFKGRHYLACLVLSLGLQASVGAETEVRGELGVDLDNYRFKSALVDTSRSYATNRVRTSHFLNVSLAGPLGHSRVANYTSRIRLLGVYFDSESSDLSVSEYIRPELSAFFGQVTLLPAKPYPLKLFHSNVSDYALRYEPNNRTDRNRIRPALSVVRRYRSDMTNSGASWQITPSDDVTVLSEYKDESRQVARVYDFDEDRDIWVNYLGRKATFGDTLFSLRFVNELDEPVTITVLNLDSLEQAARILDTTFSDVAPGATVFGDFRVGRSEITVTSASYNRYLAVVDVDRHFLASITYKDPAAPNDSDQRSRSFTSTIKYGNNDRLGGDAFYEYTDRGESVQNQTTFLNNFSNNLHYKMSDKVGLNLLTTYNTNKSTIISNVRSSQLNRSFTNQAGVSFAQRRGITGSALYVLNRNFSVAVADTLSDTLKTTMHNFTGRVTLPSSKWDYRLDVRGNVSLLSDNNDYVSNQYMADISNRIAIKVAGVSVQPQHQFKYTFSQQQNPNLESNEIESKFMLVSERTSQTLGDVRLKSEYTYRNRWSEFTTVIKSRYLMDLSIIKKLSKSYRLSFLTTHEWETVPPSGGDISSAQELEHKAAYKVDLQASPLSELSLSGNAMLIIQSGTKIKKFGLSAITKVPGIDMPLKWFLLKEARELEGREPQTQFSMETKASLRIRQMTLTMSHMYRKEVQLTETYSVHGILTRITRQFEVL